MKYLRLSARVYLKYRSPGAKQLKVPSQSNVDLPHKECQWVTLD
jgi:hypothetical protein